MPTPPAYILRLIPTNTLAAMIGAAFIVLIIPFLCIIQAGSVIELIVAIPKYFTAAAVAIVL